MAGYKGVPTIRKRLIGSQLRRLREGQGMSVEAAAEKMGVGAFTVRRQEYGQVVVSVADAKAYAEIYQADDALLQRLVGLAKHGRARGWWSAYNTTIGPSLIDVADAEDLAVDIKTWQPLLVPAILQTREYSEAVISVSRSLSTPERPLPVDDLVSLRERRKEILTREHPPRVWAIIGEAAIQQRVGGDGVMRAQLQHLLNLSQLPHVNLQLLPFDAGAHLGMGGAFVVMGFDETLDGSITLVESAGTNVFNDEPLEVGRASTQFSHLQAQAMGTDDTRRYLLKAVSAK